jgi:H+/Cl- antiporter ClcA
LDKETGRTIIFLVTIGVMLWFIGAHAGVYASCQISAKMAAQMHDVGEFKCAAWLLWYTPALVGFAFLGRAAWIYNERR